MASCPPIIHAPVRHGLFRRKTSNAWTSSRRLKTADLDDTRHLTIRGKIGLIYREIVWWAVRRAVVRSREGPVVAADRDAAQRTFGGAVRHAQAAVVEEADQAAPAIEAVGNGLGGL